MKASQYQPRLLPPVSVWTKATQVPNELHKLFVISTAFITGSRTRMSIRNSQRATAPRPFINSNLPLFYRQGLTEETCASGVREFCQLANDPTKSVVRLRLSVSSAILIDPQDWHSIIRYCLSCWGLSASPALVLTSPLFTNYIDLFMLRKTPFSWEILKPEQQKIMNRMMSLRLALRLTKPAYLRLPVPHWFAHPFSPLQYASFVSWSIHCLLLRQRLETIHQLADQLRFQYGIESDYRFCEHDFSKLCFRHDQLRWLQAHELRLGADDIRNWLDFNRVFKASPLRHPVLADLSVD